MVWVLVCGLRKRLTSVLVLFGFALYLHHTQQNVTYQAVTDFSHHPAQALQAGSLCGGAK